MRIDSFQRNIYCVLAIWTMCGSFPCIGQIRYFRPATIQGAADTVRPIPSAVHDSITTDTIFQVLSTEGLPIHYYKKIRTSVCFDNKCRLLKCILYWNITGRYLGFELEKGEYLSKARHKPFKRAEYVRLNTILADQSSVLSRLSYGELAPRPKPVSGRRQVDAVTSATARNILDDVVPGAAYTTYKMWHVVYGDTHEEVQDLTKQSLSADLIMKILDSPDAEDKKWALNHIPGDVSPTSELGQRVFSFINNSQYNLAERAINSLDSTQLNSDTTQILLTNKLTQGSYAIQKLIIRKFAQASHLTRQAAFGLTPFLNGSNPELTNNVLDLFTLHHISDAEISRLVSRLISRENTFVARKAYKYLVGLPIKDPYVTEQMKVYQKKQLQQ